MSQEKPYRIACPQCRREQDVRLYDAINASSEPALREALMENQLNAVVCEECAFSFRVDKPLLYHDTDRRMMIYWIPTADDQLAQGEDTFRETLSSMTALLPHDVPLPEIHLVFSRTELVERIFLREAGLNERIVEYIKYLIYAQNVDRVTPEEKALLFNAEDSSDESLCFVVQDLASRKLESVFEYKRSAYTALAEMFDQDEQTATLLELFPGPHIDARRLLLSESEVRDP